MARKLSLRAKFIKEADVKRLAGYTWDAMQLASSHDPEHARELKQLRKDLVEAFKETHRDIIYNHNHLVDVIERRIKEAFRKNRLAQD
jgi:hypothetical protein